MSKALPVIAAVPNYNMGQQLVDLLPELAAQNYDEIYILDDASTDYSRQVIEDFNSGSTGVKFVSTAENRGAGASRNRIIGQLGRPALIHFLDADIHLNTGDMVAAARTAIPDTPFGFVGGLALDGEGVQNPLNFGPCQGLRGDIGANIQMKIASLAQTDLTKAIALKKRFSGLLRDWPDLQREPDRRQVFWNIEQNLLVHSDIFERLGGFDEHLREHEIQDLAIRMATAGLKSYFDPSLTITHRNGQNVRPYNRLLEMVKSELYITRKHGLKNWLAN